MATFAEIGSLITGGITSIGNAIAGIFNVTESGKTNRTQLETDAQKYTADSKYSTSVFAEQSSTIRTVIISITVLAIGLLTFFAAKFFSSKK